MCLVWGRWASDLEKFQHHKVWTRYEGFMEEFADRENCCVRN